MLRIADHHWLAALPLRLLHQALHVGHLGTGGIHDPGPPPFQEAVGLPPHPVGPQQDAVPRLGLVRGGQLLHPPLRQGGGDVAVVDDAAQHPGPGVRLRQLPGHLDSPGHAEAEPGAFRLDHFHASTSLKA